ncbi:MAG: hypothetical protein FIA96_07720 [Betaproteobacteria bacterium]|nr:hypothetical protein [Betaproteobacteria bacterium]
MRPIPASRVFAIVLVAVLLVVVWFAGQRGLAEVVAQDPRYQMERWRSGKLAPDKLRLDAMQAALTDARNLDPQNPSLMEELAIFHAMWADDWHRDESEVRDARRQALIGFRKALEQRPTSGAAWFSLALMKSELEEIDGEFFQSLQLALRRGPWDPKLQLSAIELGLANWQGLTDPLREALKQSIQTQARWTLVKQKPALQALLKRYQRADLGYLLD